MFSTVPVVFIFSDFPLTELSDLLRLFELAHRFGVDACRFFSILSEVFLCRMSFCRLGKLFVSNVKARNCYKQWFPLCFLCPSYCPVRYCIACWLHPKASDLGLNKTKDCLWQCVTWKLEIMGPKRLIFTGYWPVEKAHVQQALLPDSLIVWIMCYPLSG